jgi:thioredoxin reductase (NADPH)
VVVGGGDSAMEEADFLTKFASKVTVVHRRSELRASKVMQARARANAKIEFIFDTGITDVLGTDSVTGVVLQDLKTGGTREFSCGGLFLAIGHTPSTKLLVGQVELDAAGYVILKEHTMTSVPGVFVGGDVNDTRYKQAVSAAGMGCMAALDVEKWLAEQQ